MVLGLGDVGGVGGLDAIDGAGVDDLTFLIDDEHFGGGFAGKLAGIVGPLAFGALAGVVGLREAVLVNGTWFFLGAWILSRRKT